MVIAFETVSKAKESLEDELKQQVNDNRRLAETVKTLEHFIEASFAEKVFFCLMSERERERMFRPYFAMAIPDPLTGVKMIFKCCFQEIEESEEKLKAELRTVVKESSKEKLENERLQRLISEDSGNVISDADIPEDSSASTDVLL